MELALRGIIIGLSLAAPVGPINVEIVRRGLRSGFMSGWLVGIGAITGDTLYCLLVLAGVTPLVQHAAVRTVLWIAGSAFLAFLGYSSLRAALTKVHLSHPDRSSFERRSYPTGFLMALFNPMGVVFWASIGGGLVASAAEQTDAIGRAAIVIGVILGIGLWVTTLSALVRGGRRFVSDRLFRAVNLASALLLFGFSAWFAIQAASMVS